MGYRYAWAERAFEHGYPERFAQAALSYASKAVHQAYAKGARVICPALEEYEDKVIRLPMATPPLAPQSNSQERVDSESQPPIEHPMNTA